MQGYNFLGLLSADMLARRKEKRVVEMVRQDMKDHQEDDHVRSSLYCICLSIKEGISLFQFNTCIMKYFC